MSYRSAAVLAVANLVTKAGFGNLGIVGDTAHQSRASYHNGKDVIDLYHRTAASDYTIRHPRDVAGLSDAASALDIGAGGRGFPQLRALSNAYALRCQQGLEPDTSEFIWSPDGVLIRYWDGRTRQLHTGGDGTGWGDNSHRQHSHWAPFRDTEHRDITAGWAAALASLLPDTGTEDDMTITRVKGEDWTPTKGTTYASNGCFRATPDAAAPILERVPVGTVVRSIAEIRTTAVTDNDWRLTRAPDGSARYMLRRDWNPLVAGGDPKTDRGLTDYVARTPDATPYSGADLVTAWNGGVDALVALAPQARK